MMRIIILPKYDKKRHQMSSAQKTNSDRDSVIAHATKFRAKNAVNILSIIFLFFAPTKQRCRDGIH